MIYVFCYCSSSVKQERIEAISCGIKYVFDMIFLTNLNAKNFNAFIYGFDIVPEVLDISI